MVQGLRRKAAALAATVAACASMLMAPVAAIAAEQGYQIYPTPHNVEYSEGAITLRKEATVVLEEGIDKDTEARMNEAIELKGIKAKKGDAPAGAGTTNILVGVKDSQGAVDKMVDDLVKSGDLVVADDLFDKTDAYLLAVLPAKGSAPDRVIVLGDSTDAAYYGLTTLYQILQQVEGTELRALTIADYADVITRGFIEGYYGNPWSTQDRVNLMEWGGYYKLNAYFYAPKDDPKHNAKWRELYTEEELTEKIEPLAKAGNESKCRFVFALHPFMSNPITNANYDESVRVLKEKFQQVMDHGVRQIAILADDAGNQGDALYIKLCKEMTDWLHEQQKATNADGSLKYPGLKDTLIFCPVNYMGYGESWYSQLPSNVQVINTGGRVWGKIDNNFASTFQRNSGVAPFMWINWPCSDNDKDALHMGGHNNFLGSDLKPGQVKGVVLNPMQQSEPSKQGIFMNADFTWNLWTSEAHADQAWQDSFSYIDHNSPVDNAGSDALRELSSHMLRMYGGGATWENGESADIKDALVGFRAKLTADTVTEADVDAMVKIFTDLQQTAKTYREQAGNKAMLDQMMPWIDTWDDLTRAALVELDAVKAQLAGDASALIAKFAEGTSALDEANGNSLWYINHYEYARVGKAHITPMVNALNDYVAEKAALAADPDAEIVKFVTNRTDSPVGSTDSVLDGDPATGAQYRDPNTVKAGDYFGITKNKPFNLDSVTFIQGDGKNFFDSSKIQYLQGGEWTDVPGGEVYTTSKVTASGLGLKDVDGVRIVATKDNARDAWPTINEIQINQKADEQGIFTGKVTVANQELAPGNHPLQNASDGKDTETWLTHKAADPGKDDTTVKDAAIQVTFDEPKTIDAIIFKQGGNSSDVIDNGTAYYQGTDDIWYEAGAINSDKSQTVAFEGPVQAKAIKVVNNQAKAVWWRVVDLHGSYGKTPAVSTITTNMPQYQQNSITNAADGNDASKFWSSRATQKGDWVMLDFGESKYIDTVRVLQGGGDNFTSSKVYYTTDETPAEQGNWTELALLDSAAEHNVGFDRVKATGVKLVSESDTANWFQLFELQAFEKYSYSKDNLFANFDLSHVSLSARAGGGSFKTTDGAVALAKKGDVIAVDLGSIRREIELGSLDAQSVASAELVYSQNGLEWVAVEGSSVERARYVGYRATADGASVEFNGFGGTYLDSLSPKVVKSELPGNQTLDAARAFDGDVTTATKSSGGPTAGNVVVFDLGQERKITSFDYFVPETSLDFIRNAVVEVADSADASDAEWKQVLDLNSEDIIADGDGRDTTAKDSGLFVHSSEIPGNMVKSAEGLNVSGRYLRIRFTGTYTQRWVEIGELRINGGEYVSPYAGGEFESTVVEQPGKTPANLLDKELTTAWAPQPGTGGKLVYHVSTPLKADGTPYAGVRVISHGKPSNVSIKAVVYTDDSFTAENTAVIELGSADKVLKEIGFGSDSHAVKDVIFEWPQGAEPQLSEIYLLSSVEAATDEDVAALQKALDEASALDTSAWTADSKAALDAAIAAAEKAIANSDGLTSEQVQGFIAALEAASKSPILKYQGTELGELVDGALTDGSKYTAESWEAYQAALEAARAGLELGDNLSAAEGEQLARDLKAALDALVERDPDGGSGQGGNGGTGGTGGNGGASNGGGAGGQGGKPGSNGNLAQTGDLAGLAIAAAAFAGAGALGLGQAIRRRSR